MSVAARMRKYRARKKLRETLKRAELEGVDVAAVIEEWRAERDLRAAIRESRDDAVTPIGVTAGA